MLGFKLAIDGPAGSGKSTISAKIAERLGWTHIDTGAMYRAVALLAIEKQINLENEEEYTFLENVNIQYENNTIYIGKKDVTEAIRRQDVTQYVSLVSSFPYVRKKLVSWQKDASENGNIIMDGRDIGTVVLPNADLKIFLTANVEERAQRRYDELVKKGKSQSINQVIEEILVRDKKDSTRKESPLKIADDAILLDTTHLTIEEVVNKIIALIDKKENKHGD
ncbi:MAG: (d)CMP kinase [Acholeplasmataceae bacterium]